MRISFLLITLSLILVSCKKESSVEENKDIIASESINSYQKNETKEPSTDVSKTQSTLPKGLTRSIKGSTIHLTIDASMLPVTLDDEFTTNVDKMEIKITNFDRPQIKAKISAKRHSMNIRFNQIALPNGDSDGPLSSEIIQEVKGKGDLFLSVSRSPMAEGEIHGPFSLNIE